jgi:hypothetical protein
MEVNLWTILLASGLTAIVTGLGVIPFVFFKNFNRWWLSIFQVAAAISCYEIIFNFQTCNLLTFNFLTVSRPPSSVISF